MCLYNFSNSSKRKEGRGREGGEEGEGMERERISHHFLYSFSILPVLQQAVSLPTKKAKLYKRNLSDLMSKHPNAGKRTEKKIRVTWIYEAGF